MLANKRSVVGAVVMIFCLVAGGWPTISRAYEFPGLTEAPLATTGAAPANAAPTVVLVRPANGSTFAAPATIVASAFARDTDGSIVRVAFLVDGRLYNYVTAPPYTLTLANIAGGTHTITATATDNSGRTAISNSATVTVTAPPPAITALSTTSPPRSGLLRITGTNFGGFDGVRRDGRVLINGVSAPVTRWTDTLISAYVPEATPLGATTVRVIAGAAASNAAAITVTARPPAQGRVRWRFTVDANYIQHRAAVGADGAIYANDVNGNLYALAPDGGLRWVVRAGLLGGYGPVSVGLDGTIYVAALVFAPTATVVNSGAIYAFNPDGTLKWVFKRAGGTIIAGPNVGPDGNIYAVAEYPGIGLFALSPAGALLYRTGVFTLHGGIGEEIVFGPPSQLYFGFDMSGLAMASLFGYTLDGSQRFQAPANNPNTQVQPAVGPNGNVYVARFPTNIGLSLGAYNPQGALLWNFYEFPGNAETQPDAGLDNTVYVGRNLATLLALNPNGSVKWRYVDNGILFDPIVSPLDNLIFMGGRITYGEPGFFRAVATNGQPLWRVDLPVEPGFAPYGQIIPFSRARFARDGQTAYIATDIAGDGDSNVTTQYSYFYAVDTSPPTP